MSQEMIDLASEISFEETGHIYRNSSGEVVRSMTQILKDEHLIDYSAVRPDVLAHAAWRGNKVHKGTSMLDQGIDLWNDFEVEDEIAPYIAGYQLFQMEARFELYEDWNELPMLGHINGFPIAGTVDRVAKAFGELSVIEIKATAQKHPSWRIQTAGYKKLAEQRDLGLLRRGLRRLAVQLRPNGTYKVHHFDDEGDFDTLACLLHMHQWKAKHLR